MASDVILCSGCGITLRPFMRLCPRCGAERLNATPIQVPPSVQASAPEPPPAAKPAPPPPPPAATPAPPPPPPADPAPIFSQTAKPAPAQPIPPAPTPFVAPPAAPPQAAAFRPAEPLAQSNPVETQAEVTVQKAENGAAAADQKTRVIPFDVIRQSVPRQPEEMPENFFTSQQDVIFLSPNEVQRRFPLFTGAQKTLIAIGVGLLVLMLIIAWLLWRRDQIDLSKSSGKARVNTPVTSISPVPLEIPSPTPAATDDAGITEAVKTALMAYNPLGYGRYKYDVKEGVVTINGDAEHQPEKDGVENVVRLIVGVKSVVNNLAVRPTQPAWPGDGNPGQLNAAEARVLDEAMNRQLQLAEQATNREPPAVREARDNRENRDNREDLAAKIREEEAAVRRAAEERLRREAQEYERRQEELRRAEAERRARAEQARLDASALKSGTIAWSGLIDGTDEIVISGGSASVRHVSGVPPRDVKTSFSAPLPRAPVKVQLIMSNGRGPIRIAQEPSASNGYTTIVRVDDSEKGGEKLYQFTLRWTVQ